MKKTRRWGWGTWACWLLIIAIREGRSKRAIKTTWKVFPKGESLKQQRRGWWGPLVSRECVSSLGPSDLLKAHNPAMTDKFSGPTSCSPLMHRTLSLLHFHLWFWLITIIAYLDLDRLPPIIFLMSIGFPCFTLRRLACIHASDKFDVYKDGVILC